MTRSYLAAAAVCLALAGCAGTTGTAPVTTATTATVVARIQADWPLLESAVNAYLAFKPPSSGTAATITKVEGIASAEIAALSNVSTPNSVAAAIGDMNGLVAALPPGTIPANVQADVTLLLALVNAGLVISG